MVREGSADERQAGLLQVALPFDDVNTHTVTNALSLAQALGVAPCPQVVTPAAAPCELPDRPFVVLHGYPKYRYKMWPRARWSALADALVERGFEVVLSGGPDPAERDYVAGIAADARHSVRDLAGRLSFAQLVQLLTQAQAYVGPDTAVTHLAAACGTQTVALFGPSNPVKWGPWPASHSGPDSPWPMRGSAHVGNVFLLQGMADCVPCRLEGCDRHITSDSRCLTELPMARVWAALQALGVVASEGHEGARD
jgi:heptosyltransferase-3